jgi:hypothetical protein
MGQSDIATQRGATAGVLLSAFAPVGQVSETLNSGSIASRDGETIFLTELTCEGRAFEFNHPLPVRVALENGGWTCESPEEYHLLAFGRDRSEAESSFRHIFVYCWDDIACEDDEKLAQGARNQKRALLSLVKAKK